MTNEFRAQETVLESVLGGRPLPGRDDIISFTGIADGRGVVLLDDRDLSDVELPRSLPVVGRDELAAGGLDDRTQVLEFLEPEPFPDRIGVRVRLSIVLAGRGLVPLEEIVVTFLDRDPLVVVEPTHLLTY